MAHHAPATRPDPDEVAFRGYLAEFAGPDALVHGAEAARTAGRKNLDAYVPFPVHGLDDALGVRPTRLPYLVLCMGITGGSLILLLQWWTNAVDYPWIISGKPLFSLPANIPVTFEVTVLFSAFTAFLSMIAINKLPRLYQPLFETQTFQGVTTDKFVLFVPADASETAPPAGLADRLQSWGASRVEAFYSPVHATPVPTWIKLVAVCFVSLLTIPPLAVWGMRGVTSEQPRLHVIFDMDVQPKFKAQEVSVFFADKRAMRPQVAGTVEWSADDNIEYDRGLDSSRLDETLISALLQPPVADAAAPEGEAAAPGAETPPAGAPPEEPPLPFIEEFPSELVIDDALMERGRARYNIYCAVCHGLGGDGNGLVAQRALELQQATWVPPTSLHSEPVLKQPVGQIYHTISEGVRKMPSYGGQIPPHDRWAIVLYVRALQRSRTAPLDAVPQELRADLQRLAPAAVPVAESQATAPVEEPKPGLTDPEADAAQSADEN